jgi:phage tail protein X
MREVRTIQGDTVDRICYRIYGKTAGVTEAVYEANPGLADIGPIIPTGTLVKVPEVPTQPTKATVQLWN